MTRPKRIAFHATMTASARILRVTEGRTSRCF
jgi:hypothetical protein